MIKRFVFALVVSALVSPPALAGGKYGFQPPEIYKFKTDIRLLRIHDIDGDGRQDLVFANNAQAKIEVLLRRPDPAPERVYKRGLNDPLYDSYFEPRTFISEKKVNGLAVGDFDGDGDADIVYYGTPSELVFKFQGEQHIFDRELVFKVQDVSASSRCLDAGDLNGDGKTDVALLSSSGVYLFYQEDNGPGEARRLAHAGKDVVGLAVKDINGDGLDDLLFINPARERPLQIRFQQKGKGLGPEVSFKLSKYRQLALADVDRDKATEVAFVNSSTGQLQLLEFTENAGKEKAGDKDGWLFLRFDTELVPDKRGLVTADVNRDGKLDLVISDPGLNRLLVYLQGESGGDFVERDYPSLTDLEEVDHIRDRQIVLFSKEEKAVGVFGAGEELGFPEILKTGHEPLFVSVLSLNSDGERRVAYGFTKEEGDDDEKKKQPYLGYFVRDGEKWKEKKKIKLPLEFAPESVKVADLNGDGLSDLVCFIPYEPIEILLQKKSRSFVRLPTSGLKGLGSKLGPSSVTVFPSPEGDLLAFAQKNFVRVARLEGEQLVVQAQHNGLTAASRIGASAFADIDGNGEREILLLDEGRQVISVLASEGDTRRKLRDVELPRLSLLDFKGADLDGDGAEELLILGKTQLAIYSGWNRPVRLADRGYYESPSRDANLTWIRSGDMDGDGDLELVLIDGFNNAVEIVDVPPTGGMEQGLSFKVFENKGYAGGRRGVSISEPRELVVGDLDGDGQKDLAHLVHDKLIIYLQGD